MPVPQGKFREIVFQILYSEDFVSPKEEGFDSFMMEQLKVTKKVICTAYDFVDQIRSHLKEIDEKIQKSSKAYRFERISLVERNILRLGVYELFYEEKNRLPFQIVLAEAIRLCRKFGTPQSANFVNAVLDDLYKEEKHE